MNVIVTRSSVSAGDDVEAPHNREFTFADGKPILDVVRTIADSGYLASIAGGQATWSAASGCLLAVVAQQEREPRPIAMHPVSLDRLDVRGDSIHIHFNYHQQIDPEIVFNVLRGLRLGTC
jgi:hypothetical protein